MKRRTSIHYFMAHMKIRNLVFEDWPKFNQLLNEGPEALKQYFCELWSKVKEEFKDRDDLELIDMDKKVSMEEFEILYSVLNNNSSQYRN